MTFDEARGIFDSVCPPHSVKSAEQSLEWSFRTLAEYGDAMRRIGGLMADHGFALESTREEGYLPYYRYDCSWHFRFHMQMHSMWFRVTFFPVV